MESKEAPNTLTSFFHQPALAMPDWDASNDEALSVTHHNEYVPLHRPPRRSLSYKELHRSVYPAIDPQPLYAAQAYSGKVVLVTGASRGIGQEISLQYARAGAALAILARSEDALGETKTVILKAVPSAEVLVIVADVRDTESAERAVQALLARFGRLDILVANAAAITPVEQSAYCTLLLLLLKTIDCVFCTPEMHQKDPAAWWNTFEVNVRGVFNFFRWVARLVDCGGPRS
jgi:hypothetical protein